MPKSVFCPSITTLSVHILANNVNNSDMAAVAERDGYQAPKTQLQSQDHVISVL